jgi:hypothetical protein
MQPVLAQGNAESRLTLSCFSTQNAKAIAAAQQPAAKRSVKAQVRLPAGPNAAARAAAAALAD